jgi:MoxR-like ATPase
MRQDEMTAVAASLDIGVLTDRTMFLLEIKGPTQFDDSDKELLLREAELLNALFLDTAQDLVRSGRTAYLASSHSGLMDVLTERAREEKPRSSDALFEWVRSSVAAAKKLAEGKGIPARDKEMLTRLLRAVSSVTYDFVEGRQQESRFEGGEWPHRLIITG